LEYLIHPPDGEQVPGVSWTPRKTVRKPWRIRSRISLRLDSISAQEIQFVFKIQSVSKSDICALSRSSRNKDIEVNNSILESLPKKPEFTLIEFLHTIFKYKPVRRLRYIARGVAACELPRFVDDIRICEDASVQSAWFLAKNIEEVINEAGATSSISQIRRFIAPKQVWGN